MVQYLVSLLRSFERDERGSFAIFLVAIFTTMIFVAGAAVDLVRYETVRSSLQYNLDRSVLAAASMRQSQDPAAVVLDYMDKVDTLSSFNVALNQANTSVSATGRTVSASASATLTTYFLKLAGINTMDLTVASVASENIPNLEISLVLDVSGSMGWNDSDGEPKIDSLKVAAKEFVDTMIDDSNGSLTSISIVPYAANVAVPQTMYDLYNVNAFHTDSRCIVFDAASFNVAGISTSDPLRQLYNFNQTDGYSHEAYCRVDAASEIKPFLTSKANLDTAIDALYASGSTATHIGTKWGVALLDPSASVVSATVGGSVAGRPTAYYTPDVMKIMVVMTDGDNKIHYTMHDDYRTGASDMYQVEDDKYYIYNPNTNKYYQVNSDNEFNTLPGDPTAAPGDAGYQYQLSWEEVWDDTIDVQDYANEIGEDRYDYQLVNATKAEADAQMLASCSTAKSNGISVYSIAFNAPSAAETLMRDCASTPTHFFAVNDSGANISAAFASIALSIQKLKLTQ
jgi:Flp pilus assembly protein TadG